MCGATQQQQQLESEQAAFYQEATQESNTAFAQQQALHQEMLSVYAPILQAGPSQEGFSQQEKDVLNAQAIEGTAENYEQAARATNERIAAQSGGQPSLPTGGQIQLQEELATSAAAEKSKEQTQIQEASFAQGEQNFANATSAVEGVSGELNPVAYEGAATGSGSAAATTANQIAEENNSWVNAALGAAGSLGSAVVGQNPGGIFGP